MSAFLEIYLFELRLFGVEDGAGFPEPLSVPLVTSLVSCQSPQSGSHNVDAVRQDHYLAMQGEITGLKWV